VTTRLVLVQPFTLATKSSQFRPAQSTFIAQSVKSTWFRERTIRVSQKAKKRRDQESTMVWGARACNPGIKHVGIRKEVALQEGARLKK